MNIQIKQPYTETESEDKIKKKGSLGIEKTLDLNQHGFRK